MRTHLHGALFTSWFVLFAVQTVLVQRRDIRLHQRLGRMGALLAILMVLSGSVILYHRALEYDGSQASLTNTTWAASAGYPSRVWSGQFRMKSCSALEEWSFSSPRCGFMMWRVEGDFIR